MGRVSSDSNTTLKSKADAKKIHKNRHRMYKPAEKLKTKWPAALQVVAYHRYRSSPLSEKILKDLRVMLNPSTTMQTLVSSSATQMKIEKWLASDEFGAEREDYIKLQEHHDKWFLFRCSKYYAGRSTCEFILSSLKGIELDEDSADFETTTNFFLTSRSPRWPEEETYKLLTQCVLRPLSVNDEPKRAPTACMISLLGSPNERSLCGYELFAILTLVRGLTDEILPASESKKKSYTVRVFSLRSSQVRRLEATVTLDYIKWLLDPEEDKWDQVLPINIEQTSYYNACDIEGMRFILNSLME